MAHCPPSVLAGDSGVHTGCAKRTNATTPPRSTASPNIQPPSAYPVRGSFRGEGILPSLRIRLHGTAGTGVWGASDTQPLPGQFPKSGSPQAVGESFEGRMPSPPRNPLPERGHAALEEHARILGEGGTPSSRCQPSVGIGCALNEGRLEGVPPSLRIRLHATAGAGCAREGRLPGQFPKSGSPRAVGESFEGRMPRPGVPSLMESGRPIGFY